MNGESAGASAGGGNAWIAEWEQLLHRLLTGGDDPASTGSDADAGAATADPAAGARALRAGLMAWRETLEQLVPPEQSIAELARRLASVQHAALPWLAMLSGYSESPWPSIGPLQHDQQRAEALARALADYRSASLRLADTLTELVDDCLGAYVRALEEANDQPPELRARLKLWSRVAEERYQHHLHVGPLAEHMADVANTWADCRLRGRELLDPMLDSLGLPSNQRLDDTQAHLARLQRRVTGEVERLRSEIDSLRDELAGKRLR